MEQRSSVLSVVIDHAPHTAMKWMVWKCARGCSCLHTASSPGFLKSVQAAVSANDISSPQQGNEGTLPWNALPVEDVVELKQFIVHYATINGLPQPAAPRGHNKPAPTYLPCVTTVKLVHQEYAKAGGKAACSTFGKIWKRDCQNIVI
eukprot:scpid70017/ scgid33963/ 